MNLNEQQTLALAALIQACHSVHNIASNAQLEPDCCSVLIESLFIFNPQSGHEIYPQIHQLNPGLKHLKHILKQQNSQHYQQTIRYALGCIHLQRKLAKRDDLLKVLRSRLEHIALHRESFGDIQSWTENTAQLSGVYQDTVSTLGFRLQVTGNATYLKQERYSAQIRSLLLCAIRACFLWQQSGGHRWQLLFKRRQIIRQIEQLQALIEQAANAPAE